LLQLVDKLLNEQSLSGEELLLLLENQNDEIYKYITQKSAEVSKGVFGNSVYLRGLIEISNHCKNNCYYCGIRSRNQNICRYRLTPEQILSCCETGNGLGFRTFVLQGGEDVHFTDDLLCGIISQIKERYPHCAVTLSLGERSYQSYKALFDAGADRYLLRHESANDSHYGKLHPPSLSLSKRKACLYALKEIGFQVGTGFMVGSPYQTDENIVDDLLFIKEFDPHMVGIGPFIPHNDTPFANEPAGSAEKTIYILSIIRLMLPRVLLPATTALGTISPRGREEGILAGANVIMPNLSPVDVRKLYLLYNNKIATGLEAAEAKVALEHELDKIGYTVADSRGDYQ
jgi:biotin synthase